MQNCFHIKIHPVQTEFYLVSAEKIYSINFTENNKKFCLSLHYNGADSFLFVPVQKFINLKQRILRF